MYVSLPTDETFPLKMQESTSKCHHLLQGVRRVWAISTALLICGGMRTQGGMNTAVHSLEIAFALGGQWFLQKATFLWTDLQLP